MMKKLFQILVLLLATTNLAKAQSLECSRKTHFGEAQICLPSLKGYKECYLDSLVKELADRTEVPSNTVLGYYVNDNTYGNLETSLNQGFTDYFKVYGTKQIQDYEADKSALQELRKVLDGNFIVKNWDSLKGEIDKNGLSVDIGVPVVIKTYQLNESSFTYLALVEYNYPDGTSSRMALTINGILMKRRVVWMAYYQKYQGEETVSSVQKHSDAIVEALLKANR